jgi:hypothetical protein
MDLSSVLLFMVYTKSKGLIRLIATTGIRIERV